MMGTRVICSLFFTTLLINCVTPLTCPPGTFLYTILHTGEQFCIECQDGTFIPYNDHQQPSCRPCEKIKEPELEILVSPCNKTHDAVIHCVDGYYRDEARNPRETQKCKKCTECSGFTGRPCGTYRDTICCWDENFDVVPNHHGVLRCRERPWFCRRGQYFETRYYQCLRCPENTFMPLDYHIQPECWKCREYHKYDSYRPLHSVIIQPCNITHASVIGCEDGFFMKYDMSHRDDAVGCSPCTDCSTKTDVQYEGRKCDGMEDTVCCPEANMTVVDTSKGPVCCPVANMIVVHTPKGPVCCPKDNVTVVDTSKESVCCPKANMTAVDTPDGPVCKDPLQNHVRVCGEGECQHQIKGTEVIDCAPCPVVGAKKTFSNDNQTSSGGFSLGYLFLGIVIGLVLSLACYLIYTKYYKRRRPKQVDSRKRSCSETEVQSESDESDESDPLNKASDETNTRPRRKQAKVSSRETKEPRHGFTGSTMHVVTIDEHGSEECCGNESDLHSMRESCKFVKDHERFIPANSFAYKHLPKGLREEGKMAYIKAVRDLTVRLKVNHTSKNRPKDYPYHKLRGPAGAGIKRFGTGFVFQVTKKFGGYDNATCPCRACKVIKNTAKEKWAEFAVVTAAHVVYDDIECAQTSCRMWFDDDEDYIKARSLNGIRVENAKNKTDVRIMYCITHDEKVSQKLEEKIAHLDNLCEKYHRTSTTEVEEEERLAVLISHQHALSKKISLGKAKVKMDGNIQKWSHDLLTCPGSSGAPICILGMHQKSGILTTVHGMGNESTGFHLRTVCN